MIHRTPQDLNNISICIAVFLGLWGAVLNFIRRDLKKYSAFKKIRLLILDMFMFLTLTLLVFIGLNGYGFNDLVSLSIAGLVGHHGARSIYLLELVIAERLGAPKTFGVVKEEKENKESK